MRIVSWNCNCALRRKTRAIDALNADVLVVQECEDPAQSDNAAYRAWARNYFWAGDTKRKGFGVFARDGIALEKCDIDVSDIQLVLPCLVANRLALVAVWTRKTESNASSYIGQMWAFLERHKPFLCRDECLIDGDFNSNTIWDRSRRIGNHTDVVRELQKIGIESIYHSKCGESHGSETTKTFYMYHQPEKGYHIDYAFLSAALMPNVSFGVESPDAWLAHSDHVPIFLDVGGL